MSGSTVSAPWSTIQATQRPERRLTGCPPPECLADDHPDPVRGVRDSAADRHADRVCHRHASAVAAIDIFAIDNATIVQRMLIGINSFPLLAVIFFVFTGVLMARGGVALRLVRLSEVVVGRLPGGLAQITVLSSMLFGGVSGSAVAEVSSIGATLIPAMEQAGYTKRYATAITLTSATMGPIIPPSIPMILYAYVVGSVSVAGLFLAGVVPGVLIGIGLLVACYVHGRLYHHQPAPPTSGRDKLLRVVDGLASMTTLVIILGGITSPAASSPRPRRARSGRCTRCSSRSWSTARSSSPICRRSSGSAA
jgi:hypothetical protein